MTRRVYDATVGVAWLLPHRRSKVADDLLDRLESGEDEGIVPPPFYDEVFSVLYRVFRTGRDSGVEVALTAQDVTDVIEDISALPLVVQRSPYGAAFDLGLTRDLYERFRYDLVYLALAVSLEAEFWTFDGELVRALRPAPTWVKFSKGAQGSVRP